MLEPLSLGQHVVKFDGMFGPATSPAFALDVTYFITVPEPAAGLLVLAGTALALRRRRA